MKVLFMGDSITHLNVWVKYFNEIIKEKFLPLKNVGEVRSIGLINAIELVKDKIVEGITDLRDESSIKGMRIVIELRKDVNAHVMLNNLYKYTQLQTTFGFNMIALVDGQPKTVNLKDILVEYLKHQLHLQYLVSHSIAFLDCIY